MMGPFGFGDAVIELCKEGEYIRAIKLVRDATGASLYDAKQYVDSLRANITVEITELDRRVYELWSSSERVEAVKLYRAKTNVGLKEAVDHCKALEERLKKERLSPESEAQTRPVEMHAHYGHW